jgi:hypothetical protein
LPSASQESLNSRRKNSSSSSSASEAGDGDEPNLSEGSVEEDPLQWHGDHWDQLLDYESPYIDTWPGEGYPYTHLHLGDRSVSNEHLYGNPNAQHWRRKLASLSRSQFPTLKFSSGHLPAKIPLFRDEKTDEDYQIALHLEDHLIYVMCPRDMTPFDERAEPLIKVIYQEASSETTPRDPQLPRFVIPLGPLAVRTKSFVPNPASCSNPPTELTDYQVVIDAEKEAMPLWLLCSRRTLKERHQEFGDRNPQLPIFNGLMQYEEFGYDTACMLDSVHRLGDQLSYDETCDMIRRTREVVDPVRNHATVEKMEELIGGPVPDNVD